MSGAGGVLAIRNVDLLGWNPNDRPAEFWDEQAELALDYAAHRPASDLKGFFRALRESRSYQELAALARVGGEA